jgi:hypothetical protein
LPLWLASNSGPPPRRTQLATDNVSFLFLLPFTLSPSSVMCSRPPGGRRQRSLMHRLCLLSPSVPHLLRSSYLYQCGTSGLVSKLLVNPLPTPLVLRRLRSQLLVGAGAGSLEVAIVS